MPRRPSEPSHPARTCSGRKPDPSEAGATFVATRTSVPAPGDRAPDEALGDALAVDLGGVDPVHARVEPGAHRVDHGRPRTRSRPTCRRRPPTRRSRSRVSSGPFDPSRLVFMGARLAREDRTNIRRCLTWLRGRYASGSTTTSNAPSRSRPRSHPQMSKTVEEKERVVIRFAGDSGDGMQLTGDRFTSATAVLGNDLATLPGLPRGDPCSRRAPSTASRRSRSSSRPPTSRRPAITPTSWSP